jgi:CheY-like chemotaxis protein
MSTETIELALRALEILTAWPVILFILILLFRREIRGIMPELAQRLKKVSIGTSSAEFIDVRLKALLDAIESSTEEYKNEPDKLVYSVRELLRKVPEVSAIVPENTASLSGRSMLWVDDRPMNNVYEASIFKRLGASIVFARSTKEALMFLNQDNYDLIISDVHRAEEGINNPNAGYELLEALDRQKIQIPLVFYTGSVARINSYRSKLAYGIADIPDDLIRYVLSALNVRKMPRHNHWL